MNVYIIVYEVLDTAWGQELLEPTLHANQHKASHAFQEYSGRVVVAS